MRDDLLLYYERELSFLRQMGAEFADKYPKIASRLVLEPDKCEDPHVERMLEAFAFLAARVHLKIDDEFPEITEALLGIVYPHFIRPLPSMSVAQFHLDPQQGKLTTGLPHARRGTVLYSRPVNGVPCKFRTCYETTLWPIDVAAADMDHARPLAAAIASRRRGGGLAHRADVQRPGHGIRQAGTSISSGSSWTAKAPWCTPFTRSCAAIWCRSWCAIPRPARACRRYAAGFRAAPGRF